MTLSLQNTISWARPFVQYLPVQVGNIGEPAISIASMIRNSMLNAPLTWAWNRNELIFSTIVGTQDYAQAITGNDFAFVEKVSLTDDQGNIIEIKDVYNDSALAVSSFQQRPNAVSVQLVSYSGATQTVKFRFLGVPDKVYTVTADYQKLAPQFGSYSITAVGNAAGGNTTYTGVFDPYSLPVGATATIAGLVASVNNGSFTIVSCSTSSLVVANAVGTAATSQTGYVVNYSWSPIPDQYSDVYNNLFLAEILSLAGDARVQLYRQRGVAALMSKASGLTEMQKNAFMQQWLERDVERSSTMMINQQGTQGRGI